jgi:hypothetical protein
MWGQNKPVVLSYGRPRSRWSLPPWLVLLILGAAAGAAGVIYVQEKHLPPRLSASASAELRSAYEQADAERKQLKADLAATTQKLQSAQADGKKLGEDLAAGRSGSEKLRQDLDFMVDALPADPRGGVVEVRAGRVQRKGAALAYEVALTRNGGGSKAPTAPRRACWASRCRCPSPPTGSRAARWRCPRASAPARPPSPCSTGPTAASSACASSM